MTRWFGWFIGILLLASCTNFADGSFPYSETVPGSVDGNPADNRGVQATLQVTLHDYGQAPELGNDVWLNTDQPLRLAELRGKVVLIDMWTYG